MCWWIRWMAPNGAPNSKAGSFHNSRLAMRSTLSTRTTMNRPSWPSTWTLSPLRGTRGTVIRALSHVPGENAVPFGSSPDGLGRRLAISLYPEAVNRLHSPGRDGWDRKRAPIPWGGDPVHFVQPLPSRDKRRRSIGRCHLRCACGERVFLPVGPSCILRPAERTSWREVYRFAADADCAILLTFG